MRNRVFNSLRQAAAGFASFVLVLSSVSASVPIFLSQNAGAVSSIAYSGIPSPLPPAFASLGFQATSTKEFGDRIQLAGGNRNLDTATVSLTNWACENDYTLSGSTWVIKTTSDPCTTTPGSTFTHPITINIYAVSGDNVGSLLATKTQSVNVPFRPSADPVNCTGTGKWFDAATNACYNGLGFTTDFDLSTPGVTLPADIIATIAFDTQSYGSNPTGVSGPYNSLNVSLVSTAPTTGSNVEQDTMYWDTTYPGYTTGLKIDTGWTPYSLGLTLTTTQAATATETITGNTSAGENLAGWMFNRDQTSKTPFAFTSTTSSTGVGSLYVKPIGSNASDKFIAENFTQTPVNEFNSLSYDYKIAGNGTDADKNKFYTNVYANIDSSTNYFDCRFDYVANVGSSSDFVTTTFKSTDTPTSVKQRGARTVCPATLAAMPSGSYIRAYAVTAGDTTTTDLGLAAYYDNVVINTSSLISQYDLEPTPIAAPTDFTPANATTTNDNDFDMSWPVVAGATKYEYRTANTITNPTTLGTIIYSDNSAAGNYTVGADTVVRGNNNAPDANYYWQVRAGNDEGTWSEWSAISKVTVDTASPTVPINGQPNAQSINTNDFYFTWSDSSTTDTGTAIKYEFQSSTANAVDGNGSLIGSWNSVTNGNSEQNNLTTPTIHSTGAGEGTYFWQVRAFDAAGNKSAWSTVWNMTIDSTKPGTPQNVKVVANGSSLSNPAFTNQVNVVTSWDGVAGASSYQYKYWNNIVGNQYKEDSAYVTTVNGTSIGGAFNQGAGTHYIQIRSIDAAGNISEPTAPFVITYDTTAPDVAIQGLTQGQSVTGTVNIAGIVTDTNPMNSYFKITGPNNYKVESLFTDGRTTHNYAWNTAALPNGTYTIQFEARDKSDNKDAGSVTSLTVTVNNPQPIVSGENFNTHSGTDYKGLNVGFNIANFKTVTGVTVALYDADNSLLVTNTDNELLLELIESETTQLSTPFITVAGTYEEEYWNVGTRTWTADDAPVKAIVTVTGTNNAGTYVEKTTDLTTLSEADGVTFVSILPVVTIPVVPTPADESESPTTDSDPATTPAAEPAATPAALPQNLVAFATPQIVNIAADNDDDAEVLGAIAEQTTDDDTDVKGVQTSDKLAVIDGTNTFFGLAWYWWIVILAGIAGLIWMLAALRRNPSQS